MADFILALASEIKPLALVTAGLDFGRFPPRVRPDVIFEEVGELAREDVEEGMHEIARELNLPVAQVGHAIDSLLSRAESGPGFNRRVNQLAGEILESWLSSVKKPI